MRQPNSGTNELCCDQLFFVDIVEGRTPRVTLECCSCGRLWHFSDDNRLVPVESEVLMLKVDGRGTAQVQPA